jgi:hypothetical protein
MQSRLPSLRQIWVVAYRGVVVDGDLHVCQPAPRLSVRLFG